MRDLYNISSALKSDIFPSAVVAEAPPSVANSIK